MTIVQALTVAFAFTGQAVPAPVLAEMAAELSVYREADVLAALKRCRAELKSIKYSDILDRLPNGHPGPEEAWACVSRALQNEAVTVVWTEQMREAYGVACALANDQVAARLAFKEVYQRLVSAARARGERPIWSVSRGTDRADQELQITAAVKVGRITNEYAQRLLPAYVDHFLALALSDKLLIGRGL